MTTHRRAPAGPRRPDGTPQAAAPRPGEKNLAETAEPYDLPFPDDYRLPRRPDYVIVVDQLRGWQPTQPPSLAELLERGRTRQPEPDLEAEP